MDQTTVSDIQQSSIGLQQHHEYIVLIKMLEMNTKYYILN